MSSVEESKEQNSFLQPAIIIGLPCTISTPAFLIENENIHPNHVLYTTVFLIII